MNNHATINYMSRDGDHIDSLDTLDSFLEDIALTMEDYAEPLNGKGKAALLLAAGLVRDLIPDMDAMPPEPDPVAEAQALLREERRAAQALLVEESARIQKESTIKEAFCIPGGLLSNALLAAMGDDVSEEAYSPPCFTLVREHVS